MAPLPTWVLTERRSAQYDALKVFLSELKLAHVTELSAIPFGQLVTNSALIMWDHDGECSCGRRTYLMSQCIKCLEEEIIEKIKDEAEAALALPVPAPEVSSAGGTRRLATPIPSELVRLPNKLRLVTDKVIFIDDATIASFAAKPSSWEYGVVSVCIWDGTRDCTLPSPSKPASSKYFFRIAFRKDPDGTVIPVQQCVDVRREPACVLLASQFPNHARYVYKVDGLGSLPGPLRELMERTWTRFLNMSKVALQMKLEPIVKQFCASLFTPCKTGLMLRVHGAKLGELESIVAEGLALLPTDSNVSYIFCRLSAAGDASAQNPTSLWRDLGGNSDAEHL